MESSIKLPVSAVATVSSDVTSMAIKSVATIGGGTVGYCSGAALVTGIGFAVFGPVGASIGYGIGILFGAGAGAVLGYKAGKVVTHALELPENASEATSSGDEDSTVIEAPSYSVS